MPTDAGAPGRFIVFEGGDGAGKTTQIKRLATSLREGGRTVVLTREPGGTELGKQLRELVLNGDYVAPRAEALLFAADRAHHVATLVRPALQRGNWVIQDRYLDSSVAYQGAGRELKAVDIQRISRWATQDLIPDLTILLDISPSEGRSRRGAVEDRLEREADDFHSRVREGYRQLALAEPERYLVIDATLPRGEISALIQRRMAQL